MQQYPELPPSPQMHNSLGGGESNGCGTTITLAVEAVDTISPSAKVGLKLFSERPARGRSVPPSPPHARLLGYTGRPAAGLRPGNVASLEEHPRPTAGLRPACESACFSLGQSVPQEHEDVCGPLFQ